MKAMAIWAGLVIICIIGVFIVQTTSDQSSRKQELETSVSDSLKVTLEGVNKYNSNEEMANAFVKNLKTQMTAKQKTKVDIIDIDYENGLLSVLVESTYRLSNGKEKILKVRKNAILEKKAR